MSLAIVIPTYQRKDNTTPYYLKRALLSIKNQTYDNYKVYLIGDNYENKSEFKQIAESIIEPNKIKYINLPIAVERVRYNLNDIKLWASGGVNATNYGIELALMDGYSYICRLDHDDYWHHDHLRLISERTGNGYTIISTLAEHINNQILPKNGSNPFYPKSSNLVHASTCVDFKSIPLRYRDVFFEEGRVYAADADLWDRLSIYMLNNNLVGYLINEITVYHKTEKSVDSVRL